MNQEKIISFIESLIQHTGLALFERNSNGKIEKIIKEIEEYERKYNFQLPPIYKKFTSEYIIKKQESYDEDLFSFNGREYCLTLSSIGTREDCLIHNFSGFMDLDKLFSGFESVSGDLDKQYGWNLIRIAYSSAGAGNGLYLGYGVDNMDKIYKIDCDDLPYGVNINTLHNPFVSNKNGVTYLAKDTFAFVDTLTMILLNYGHL
jgi:hypothetical protein